MLDEEYLTALGWTVTSVGCESSPLSLKLKVASFDAFIINPTI
jgi:hypothetical protein